MGERLEFYLYEGELWCKDDKGGNYLVDQHRIDLVEKIYNRIKEDYPEAFQALRECYKESAPNKIYYRFIMVQRFLKCNLGQLDSMAFDFDNGIINFERMDCPIRLDCKYDGVICNPIYKTSLSASEMRVGMLWYDGLSKEEIAGMLYLSPETVNNHIRSIYRKLDIHEKADFVKYVKEHNLNRR